MSDPPASGRRLAVKTRYRAAEALAEVVAETTAQALVRFERPQPVVAPGNPPCSTTATKSSEEV